MIFTRRSLIYHYQTSLQSQTKMIFRNVKSDLGPEKSLLNHIPKTDNEIQVILESDKSNFS